MTDVLAQPAAAPLQVALLGPLRVTRAGDVVEVRGGRLRRLLVALALAAGRPVGSTALTDALWPDVPPADPVNALQSLVSRLRSALGDAAAVQQVAGGYLLAVPPDAVDALRFERLAREPGRAAEALELWRGELPPEVPAVRLLELRLGAQLARTESELSAGTDVTAPLAELAREHPEREDVAGLRMLALSRQGRQAEALQEYERIRDVLADGLGADPSAELVARHLEVLRARPAPAQHNLRAPLTSFVGRDRELTEIADRLRGARLVTVVGPGGAGKTRVATEAAGRSPAPGGTWLVELAPVTDPDDVAPAVLSAVGLREAALLDRRAAPREVLLRLVEALTGQGVLLVLDNAEHLLDAVAALCDVLLARCPDLRVLVTSREALGIAGEALVPLAPLDVPAEGSTPAEALAHPSVALFADRASAVRPGFAVDAATVRDVVELVRRLDGLPLALELAAARLRSLPLADVVRRLDDRFRLLTGGSRTALPRHRTLRAVVAWSWDLLSEPERRLAERASVFAGGLTEQSAAAVVDGDVGELLAALVDKSLLQLVDGPRYRMLETLREYGAEQLAESGELAEVRLAHARWYADLAARADPALRTADQVHWLEVLQTERDDLLAALHCLTDTGDVDAALRMGLDLGWYWLLVGRHAEAATALAPVLALPPGRDRAAWLGARLVQVMHEAAAGGSAGAEHADAVLRELAAELETVEASGRPLLALLAPVAFFLVHDVDTCSRLLDRAVRGGDDWLTAAALLFRARFRENAGDLAGVRRDLGPALEGFRRVGDRWGLASGLPLAALLQQYDGDLDGALATLQEAADLADELGALDGDDAVFIAMRLSDVHLRLGDRVRALRVLTQAAARVPDDRGGESAAFLAAQHAGHFRAVGDLEAARSWLRRAQARLPAAEPLQTAPHAVALVAATGMWVDVEGGDLEGARSRRALAHEAAVATRDLPIASVVAVAVARLALAEGDPGEAAVLLGAATRMRGSEDATAVEGSEVREAAVAALGQVAYDAAYAEGLGLDVDAALARTRGPVRPA